MKYIVGIILFTVSILAQAQDYIKKRVVTEEGIPLAYSTILLKPGNKGTIANEDGFFILPKNALASEDSVIISHLGFKSMTILASELEIKPIISLKESVNELQQVSILPGAEKRWAQDIFEAFEKRRSENLEMTTSGRLTLRSYEGEIPVEVLEGESVVSIDKTGLPQRIDFSYLSTNMDSANRPLFYSIHSSMLIESFNPFQRSEVSTWSLHPGRLGKKSIRNEYEINLLNYNVQSGISKFEMVSQNPDYLSATIWLTEEKNKIIRYEVFGSNLSKIPIVSLKSGKKITNFSVDLKFDFGSDGEELTYLVWDYSFTFDGWQNINSSVELLISDKKIQKPLFLVDKKYHDYALAAMLPKRSEKLETELELIRSKKDAKALSNLQENTDLLETSLVFWYEDAPFDVSHIYENKTLRKDGSRAKVNASHFPILGEKYNLTFNAIVFPSKKDDFDYKAFFDKNSSSMPKVDKLEIKLLVNLLFDEYAFAAKRLAAGATPENIEFLRDSEVDELDLRIKRLLINSKAGNDLSFLLEKNYANYELHGIDRFYQLTQRSYSSPLLQNFDKHIDPSDPFQNALAHFLIGDYNGSINLLKMISEDQGKVIYLKALNHYFKNQCAEYKRLLNKSKKMGFDIPEEAKDMCF